MEPVKCLAEVHTALVQSAQSGFPEEVCGLLFGRGQRITHAVSLPNIAYRPRTTFLLDGQSVTRTLRQHYSQGLEWVGIYHSHPQGESELSPADLYAAVGYPGVWQFLIVLSGYSQHAECHLYDVSPTRVRRLHLTIVT